ncbi:Putative molybdopterin molybdenumtransferase, MoeA-like [Desulfonema limicola]|uniref:Molybdopterin molybdenumtransferase n=1 Tax=Desulfonema limicola TaxID=45656 RepID=A0A975GGU4_9BACT|nr:molybdopterin molybdotransferase MoeA [Desulfonema limicola]QTA80715.1 Putative molybdopterin molybdenumtransferase, MoeA-like [Desulfonema limicola]
MKKNLIGHSEALKLTFEHISPLESEIVPLTQSASRVSANELCSLVDSPSVDASLKDGYAVRSQEIENADEKNPVCLKLTGSASAGEQSTDIVEPGTAVRILTGAKIPGGADAVVAEEFTQKQDSSIIVKLFAEPGRNILLKGSDVARGEQIAAPGTLLVPGMVGLLAAAGYGEIPVIRNPKVAIIATGDEVVAPGRPLPEGKLFASNLMTLNAWCFRYGFTTMTDIVQDDALKIKEKLHYYNQTCDAVLTSGGAWTGDRDFVVSILEELGWNQIFHRIRIGPGKAVGFGILNNKPVFVLPGGPPSNLLGFLQIALPGLLKLAGHQNPKLPEMSVILEQDVDGRHIDWTQFIFGHFIAKHEQTFFRPLKMLSRLQSMARAEGIISIPEGKVHIPAGTQLSAQLLV